MMTWEYVIVTSSSSNMIYQVNIRVFLKELSKSQGKNCTLDDFPQAELVRLQSIGITWIYLLSVWHTGPEVRLVSLANPSWRKEFIETLPDLTDDDIGGSGFAIYVR